MKTESGKQKISMTTIVLSVVLAALVISTLSVFVIYPAAHKYHVAHRSYPVYGGLTDELKDSEYFSDMQSGRSFCFLGDSITYGSATEGIHWYQPLMPYIQGDITDLSHSGWTVKSLIDEGDNIPVADIYVIAIGINDILFPYNDDSARTSDDFVNRCSQLGDILTARSPGAKIYFIAPWSFVDIDISFVKRGDQFRNALKEWCADTDYRYINPDPVIQSVIAEEGSDKYMYNDFHPNAPEGVGLFSYAVLKDAHQIKEDAVLK